MTQLTVDNEQARPTIVADCSGANTWIKRRCARLPDVHGARSHRSNQFTLEPPNIPSNLSMVCLALDWPKVTWANHNPCSWKSCYLSTLPYALFSYARPTIPIQKQDPGAPLIPLRLHKRNHPKRISKMPASNRVATVSKRWSAASTSLSYIRPCRCSHESATLAFVVTSGALVSYRTEQEPCLSAVSAAATLITVNP